MFYWILKVRNKIHCLFKQHILSPVLALLDQGHSLHHVARGIALGFVCSFVPVIGLSTALSFLLAWLFGHHQIAAQIGNLLGGPLQLLLLIPFLRLGEWLFGVKPQSFDVSLMIQSFKSTPLKALSDYGLFCIRACVAWMIVAFLMYWVMRVLFSWLIVCWINHHKKI